MSNNKYTVCYNVTNNMHQCLTMSYNEPKQSIMPKCNQIYKVYKEPQPEPTIEINNR